mmetsp:Transcript_43047/g.131081  ORF Transcript_43047/g.131081 Transcript_43047/m.131081 type:complete len:241 (-) Transcript_43047:195-917(-)
MPRLPHGRHYQGAPGHGRDGQEPVPQLRRRVLWRGRHPFLHPGVHPAHVGGHHRVLQSVGVRLCGHVRVQLHRVGTEGHGAIPREGVDSHHHGRPRRVRSQCHGRHGGDRLGSNCAGDRGVDALGLSFRGRHGGSGSRMGRLFRGCHNWPVRVVRHDERDQGGREHGGRVLCGCPSKVGGEPPPTHLRHGRVVGVGVSRLRGPRPAEAARGGDSGGIGMLRSLIWLSSFKSRAVAPNVGV